MREIERKFIVHALPAVAREAPRVHIRQGYLVAEDEGLGIRVRQLDRQLLLTIKSGAGLVRHEVEVPLQVDQFEALWTMTLGQRVEKTRHLVALGRWTAEVDVFEGPLAGLIIAEVEFGTVGEAETFEPPDWFGREVTLDLRYQNRHLARLDAPPEARSPSSGGRRVGGGS